MARCINIDWLECFCQEDSINYPHDAEYFRACGFLVNEREYGTQVYNEMFTILDDHGEPCLEVRRNPKSGIMDPYAAHVRLHNRTCYLDDAAGILQNFIEQHGFHFIRLSRIDLALDFERFDSGDYPDRFIKRYIEGRYSKVNPSRIRVNGTDTWSERKWNSIAWGSVTSMIRTRLYDKTQELREVKDKPYIRYAWLQAGLIDDTYTLLKMNDDGTQYAPRIWRLEFEVKTASREYKWFHVEDHHHRNYDKPAIRSFRHTLSCYRTRQQLLDVFFSLTHYYFHFKVFQEGIRKDRLEDKILFKPTDQQNLLKLDKLPTATPTKNPFESLISKLTHYKLTHFQPATVQACDKLIGEIELERRRNYIPLPITESELQLLREVIRIHTGGRKDITIDTIAEEIRVIHDIFEA